MAELHMNSHGTKRLLKSIDNICPVTKQTPRTLNIGQRHTSKPRPYGMPLGGQRHFSPLDIVIYAKEMDIIQLSVGTMAGMLV